MNRDVLRETLKNLAPKPVRRLARELLKWLRDRRNLRAREQGRVLDQAGIVTALRNLGVNPGDTLIVHSSLSRLGFVEGGVDAVVAALHEVVGATGTLGAPTFWTVAPHTVEPDTVFDVIDGKSQLGIISDRIRKLPGAVRSLHPTHSATFVGPRAVELTCEHHQDAPPVGPHSPYRKLVDIGGKILLLGVSLEYLTSFHTIEDEVTPFPYQLYDEEPKTFRVRTATGEELALSALLHDGKTARLRQCIKMEPHLQAAGVMVRGTVGEGTATLLDARKLHHALHALLRNGISIYAPDPGG